jgi:hypothetical protein
MPEICNGPVDILLRYQPVRCCKTPSTSLDVDDAEKQPLWESHPPFTTIPLIFITAMNDLPFQNQVGAVIVKVSLT